MIKSYLVSVWRHVSRNRGFTIINILGLIIGITAFMLIGQYVKHELSYDQFWLFAWPSLLVIALGTVSIHTLRAARTNPATSLRYE